MSGTVFLLLFYSVFNQFNATVLFLYPQKTWFFDVFRGYIKRPVAWNGLAITLSEVVAPVEVFLGKGVLKIYSIFTGEHPCRSVISMKLLCNFIWNQTLACVFWKFIVYFQNTFSKEHTWRAAFVTGVNYVGKNFTVVVAPH